MSEFGSRRSMSLQKHSRYNPITHQEYDQKSFYDSPVKNAYGMGQVSARESRDSAPKDIHISAAREILRQSYHFGDRSSMTPTPNLIGSANNNSINYEKVNTPERKYDPYATIQQYEKYNFDQKMMERNRAQRYK